MQEQQPVPKVDEFDHLCEPVTDAEADELVEFVYGVENQSFADEIRSLRPEVHKWRHLLRPIVDDMHRIKAGRRPRYSPFEVPTPPAIPESSVRTPRD